MSTGDLGVADMDGVDGVDGMDGESQNAAFGGGLRICGFDGGRLYSPSTSMGLERRTLERLAKEYPVRIMP